MNQSRKSRFDRNPPDMCSKQCMGITKKGARCLIKVNSGDFCHYHVPGQKYVATRLETRHDKTHQSRTPQKSDAKRLPSLPAKPVRTKPPTHVPSKKYTTVSGSSNGHIGFFSSSKHGKSQPSPIKYNNLERPLTHDPSKSPTRRVIDYNAIPSSSKYRYSPKVELAIQPGYIYVYTLSSFLSKHADGGWVQTRNLSRDKRHQDKWVDVDMRRSQKLLVKVGMTTKTPATRIQQWEAKCNHELSCLYPGSHPFLGRSSITRMLGNLSLSDNSESKKYRTYVEHDHGFFVPRNILHCEQQIHSILKQKFGRGEIHCTGCHGKAVDAETTKTSILDIFKSKKEAAAKPDYNIHNEWFPVPRKNLSDVFAIIDSECSKYKP